MLLGVLVVAFTVGAVRAEDPGPCSAVLVESPVLTAEAGSIADLEPESFDELANLFAIAEAEPRLEELSRIVAQIERLATRTRDARLAPLLIHALPVLRRAREAFARCPAEFFKPRDERRRVISQLSELLVATMIAGQEILVGVFLDELHPELAGRGGHREADVVARTRTGAERWIEVKNWGRFDESRARAIESLERQDRATRELRLLLPHLNIRRELVLRDRLPADLAPELKRRTLYDRVAFACLESRKN